MAGKVPANLIVPTALIGIDCGFVVHIGAHNLSNLGHRMRVDMEATGRAAAFNERENDVAEGNPGLLAALGRESILADESLVRFHDLARAAHRPKPASAHCLTDAMHHEPHALIAHLNGPAPLIRAATLP